MNQKVNSQQFAPVLIVVLLFAALGVLAAVLGGGPRLSFAPRPLVTTAEQANVAAFDSAAAADLSAARWQSMAKFYEDNGLLTRDPFDYSRAAERHAARWLAMARFYEDQGMLTRDPFDSTQAADLSAYRWQAMARFYEGNGMLNDQMDSGDLSAYRWTAMGRAYERMGLLNK